MKKRHCPLYKFKSPTQHCWPIRSELVWGQPCRHTHTQSQPNQKNSPKSPDPFPSQRVGSGNETSGSAVNVHVRIDIIMDECWLSICKYQCWWNCLILTHIFTFQVCMFCSAGYHMFSCQSELASRRWLSLDLAGVSVGMCGCYFPGAYYAFYCDTVSALEYVYTHIEEMVSQLVLHIHWRWSLWHLELHVKYLAISCYPYKHLGFEVVWTCVFVCVNYLWYSFSIPSLSSSTFAVHSVASWHYPAIQSSVLGQQVSSSHYAWLELLYIHVQTH